KHLSLVMSDLDNFKKINDTYGHTCGDYVLQQIADCISKQLRETDFVARFGGEEFVMLLPETNIKEAVIAMNKLRAYIQQLPLQFNGKTFNVNMSFGVATFEAKDDYNLVFNRADTALYRAKSRGRNQVCAELKKSV
ncbi:MAG: GGDEF domain-containing protein, partial [Enterobacterales bacterium]|nr:GGDEF domain-containing protein [Enterobacterales bacterium]